MQKFILILIIIYFIFKLFRRFIFVSVYKSSEKRTRQDFEKFNGNSPDHKKEEGKVTITVQKPNDSKSGNDSQFTDYEEIK